MLFIGSIFIGDNSIIGSGNIVIIGIGNVDISMIGIGNGRAIIRELLA